MEEARRLAKQERIAQLRAELIDPDLEVDEVAEVLGLERSTVLRYLREHLIIGYQAGRTWRVPVEELRAYKERLLAREREERRLRLVQAELERKFALRTRTDPEKGWEKRECPQCGAIFLTSRTMMPHPEVDTWLEAREGECEACGFRYERVLSDEEQEELDRARIESRVRRKFERLRGAGLEVELAPCDRCACQVLLEVPTADDIEGLDVVDAYIPNPNEVLVGSCELCHSTQVSVRSQREEP